MKKILCLSFVLFLRALLFSQTEVELRLTLRDGNVVSGKSKISSITLQTSYGKLEIPVQHVSSLDLGITSDKATADKVLNLAKQLANSNEQMRKTAYEELLKMDIRAIPAISGLLSSQKYEPSTFTDYTIESALSELQTAHSIEGDVSGKDVVSIDFEYSMGGYYDFAKIDLKTEYGTLSIPKEKIRHIDVVYAGSPGEGEMTFKLLASKHISSNPNGGWLKTGIMVKAGQKLSISANGEVTFASLSGAKYKPDGSMAGAAAPAIDNFEGDYNYGTAYPAYGNVVFKIGEASTSILKAGAKYTGTVPNTGMLYISIYETVYNATNAGSYSVKVSLK